MQSVAREFLESSVVTQHGNLESGALSELGCSQQEIDVLNDERVENGLLIGNASLRELSQSLKKLFRQHDNASKRGMLCCPG
jgi:hypothetical protein